MDTQDELERVKGNLRIILEDNRRMQIEMMFAKQTIDPAEVAKFMDAADQPPNTWATTLLYHSLVQEEYGETMEAFAKLQALSLQGMVSSSELVAVRKELLDGGIDLIVTVIGLLRGAGMDIVGGYNEVMRSNLTKIGADGKVVKNNLGKVIKPEGYRKPELEPFV